MNQSMGRSHGTGGRNRRSGGIEPGTVANDLDVMTMAVDESEVYGSNVDFKA